MKRKVISMALALCLLMPVVGCGGNEGNYIKEEPDYSSYENTLQMHIGGWVSPPPAQKEGDTDYCTQENYDDIADFGINTIYGLYEPWGLTVDGKNANERALGYAEKAGIGFYIRDFAAGVALQEADQATFDEVFGKYLEYDSFAGIMATDEPSTAAFAEIAAMRKGWDKFIPEKDFYVNLFPTYAMPNQLGISESENYRENYVRRFLDETGVKFLSYDHYPLLVDGWGNGSLTVDYLFNLEVCAEEARDAGVPFWTFLQAMSYDNATRCPTEQELRWQVLCSMAFGAQGYQYFCYWTPPGQGDNVAKSACVTEYGEKTPVWYAGQKINREILNFDHVYLNYEWQGLMPVLGGENTKNKLYNMMEHPLESIDRIRSVKSDQDVIIGAFKDNADNDAFMVVNFSDPGENKACTAEIEMKGVSSAVVYMNGERNVAEAKGGKLTLEMEAGNGAFIIPLQ